MLDYILLMHDDSVAPQEESRDALWVAYIGALQASGNFQGGSSIGSGTCMSRSGTTGALSTHLVGFIRVRAADLNHARELVQGNPVFEAGGTVEIRELLRT